MIANLLNRHRKFLSEHGYHLVFAASLFALAALVVWWSVFIIEAINERHETALGKLRTEARMLAAIVGHLQEPPGAGPLSSNKDLVIRPAPGINGDYSLQPNWPGWAIGIAPEKAEEIEHKYRRQKFMWIGEGSLLFLLIFVSTIMLWRLVGLEHRYRIEMDRFLDLVTHELKTPLAGVRTLLQTIALGRVDPETLPQVTSLGMKNLERLDHLVQNILIRNRLRHKIYVTQEETLDLSEFARGVIQGRVEAGIAGRKPVLTPVEGVAVKADRESLRVVLDNLLDNAEKYGKSETPVCVEVSYQDDAAVLAVSDEGTGIAHENLQRVFNPFFRVQSKAARPQKGSGLGLAICRDLVHRMGGTITAKSDGLGKGARFEVRLPRVKTL